MRQRPFVLEHLAEVADVDPAAAGWARSEVPQQIKRND
jgi:hypothetical protein